MADLSGKVMVITGGCRGIGLATARRWQAAGGVAVALDLEVVSPEGTGPEHVLTCDVTAEPQVIATLVQVEGLVGRVDALFHNAGILGPNRHITSLDRADWDRVLAVHLTGGYLLAKHGVPALRRAGGGSLLFNASMVAETGSPAYPGYAAAKAGLVSLTGSLAMLLARDNIRVNAISPGSVVGTGFNGQMPVTDLARLVAAIPLGRAGTADDIAATACFLASPDARHITGAVLPVDGGERYRTFTRS